MAKDCCTCIWSTMQWGKCRPGTGCRLWRDPGEPVPVCPRDGKPCSHLRPAGMCCNDYAALLVQQSLSPQ